jgi:folylpolyglutamate synthase
MEVGVGGRYDATNIITRPMVTAVTSLGMMRVLWVGIDHTAVLGNTLSEIAWHKAGIFKSTVPAFTSDQPIDALAVLEAQAEEIGVSSLTIVTADVEATTVPGDVVIGLPGKHQRSNAALAFLVVNEFFKQFRLRRGSEFWPSVGEDLSAICFDGIRKVTWPGRGQIIVSENIQFLLDGAHTVDSMEACAEWIKDTVDLEKGIDLIFNCTGGRENLLAPLAEMRIASGVFKHVVFCTNETYKNAGIVCVE